MQILTNRKFESWPSWHIVHEWEDVLSIELNIPLKNSGRLKSSLLTKINDKLTANIPGYQFARECLNSRKPKTSIVFHMRLQKFVPNGDIPIIIDFWKPTDLKKFYKAYRNCEMVLITSKEVYDYLKEQQCPLNIHHLALSLPDKYFSADEKYDKSIDIIQAGRSNDRLTSYVMNYVLSHPNVNYVYQKSHNGELRYHSTVNGDMGSCTTREQYIELLKSCKVALYSSPGLDKDAARVGDGFNQITPRFLEYLASGCDVIGRYVKNSDADYYDVSRLCPNIKDENHFSKLLTSVLSESEKSDQVKKQRSDYLNKHLTSARAKALKTLLNSLSSH